MAEVSLHLHTHIGNEGIIIVSSVGDVLKAASKSALSYRKEVLKVEQIPYPKAIVNWLDNQPRKEAPFATFVRLNPPNKATEFINILHDRITMEFEGTEHKVVIKSKLD